jgi:hypothetical protein
LHFLRGLSPVLERGAAFRKGKAASAALFDPAVRKWNGDGGFLFSVFCDWNCIYFQSSKSSGKKWQVFARIPDVAVTGAACTRNCQGGHETPLTRSRLMITDRKPRLQS